jgi:hypothetical protein
VHVEMRERPESLCWPMGTMDRFAPVRVVAAPIDLPSSGLPGVPSEERMEKLIEFSKLIDT